MENLFSLMDFAHDKKISEEEFLKATMHYRFVSSRQVWKNLTVVISVSYLSGNLAT